MSQPIVNQDDAIEPGDFQITLRTLRAPVPAALIKSRKQGGTNVEYLEWSSVADILDRYASSWTYEVKEVREIAKRVVATVAITINGVRRENTGIEDIDMKGYGDPISNAVAMAFKRCAAMFGVGRDLYQDHSVPAILDAAEAQKEKHAESQRHATIQAIKMVADSKKLKHDQVQAFILCNKFDPNGSISNLAMDQLQQILAWVKAQPATDPVPNGKSAKQASTKPAEPPADPTVKANLIQNLTDILPEAHTSMEALLTAINKRLNKFALIDLTTAELGEVLSGYRKKARDCRERQAEIYRLLKEESEMAGTTLEDPDMPDLADFNYTEMGVYLETTKNRVAAARESKHAVAVGQ